MRSNRSLSLGATCTILYQDTAPLYSWKRNIWSKVRKTKHAEKVILWLEHREYPAIMLNQLFSNTEGRGRMTSMGSYRIRLGLFDTGSFWSFNIPGSGSILAATLHDLLKKKQNKNCQDTCRSHIQLHIWMQWKNLFKIEAVPVPIAEWYFSDYFLRLVY